MQQLGVIFISVEDFKCPWPSQTPSHRIFIIFCYVVHRFQLWFFWRWAISCCQNVCCFFPASHGTLSGEPDVSRYSVYLSIVIGVSTAWQRAEYHMFPQNQSVSRSLPVAGWEHGTLDLSHIVVWITWTGLFPVRIAIHSANAWTSLLCVYWGKIHYISFSILVVSAGFILISKLNY